MTWFDMTTAVPKNIPVIARCIGGLGFPIDRILTHDGEGWRALDGVKAADYGAVTQWRWATEEELNPPPPPNIGIVYDPVLELRRRLGALEGRVAALEARRANSRPQFPAPPPPPSGPLPIRGEQPLWVWPMMLLAMFMSGWMFAAIIRLLK